MNSLCRTPNSRSVFVDYEPHGRFASLSRQLVSNEQQTVLLKCFEHRVDVISLLFMRAPQELIVIHSPVTASEMRPPYPKYALSPRAPLVDYVVVSDRQHNESTFES
jgi:hypothetical protein